MKLNLLPMKMPLNNSTLIRKRKIDSFYRDLYKTEIEEGSTNKKLIEKFFIDFVNCV